MINRPYALKIKWDAQRPINPKSELVVITFSDASENVWTGTVATTQFIEGTMKKDRLTGECAGGEYFCAPNLVIVRSVDEVCLRNAIDDLERRGDLEQYFTKA